MKKPKKTFHHKSVFHPYHEKQIKNDFYKKQYEYPDHLTSQNFPSKKADAISGHQKSLSYYTSLKQSHSNRPSQNDYLPESAKHHNDAENHFQ